jgi:hypothetical protein
MATRRSAGKAVITDSDRAKQVDRVVASDAFQVALRELAADGKERERAKANPRAWLRRNHFEVPASVKLGFIDGPSGPAEREVGPLCFWHTSGGVTQLWCIYLNPLHLEIRTA